MDDENGGFTGRDALRLLAGLAWLVVFVFRPRLVSALTLLGIGGSMLAYNAVVLWSTLRDGAASSTLPLLGGVLTAAGVALLPLDGAWQWAGLPLLLDWGGLPRLLEAAYHRWSA